MRHLPKTEYTEADSRADAAFLVGAAYGRALAEEDKAVIWDEAYSLGAQDERDSAEGSTPNPYRKAK